MQKSLVTKEKGSKSWIARSIVVVLIAIVLLYLAFQDTDFASLYSAAMQGKLEWIFLGCVLFTLSLALRSLRWRVLLSTMGDASIKKTFGATIIGYLGNAFLPARIGEVLRSMSIHRSAGIPTVFALTTTFTERILDAAFLVIISLILIASLDSTPIWLTNATQAMGILGMVAIIVLLTLPRFENFFKKMLVLLPMPQRLREILQDVLEKLISGIRILYSPSRMVWFGILTLAAWSVDVLIAHTVAAAFDIHMTVVSALLLLAALGLSSAVPSTPGYVGIYQFVSVTVLAVFGIGRNEALIFILTYQAIIYVVLLFWGLPSVWLTRPENDLIGTE